MGGPLRNEAEKMIIFSPGPANISERVRRALTRPDICHRDTEFTAMLGNVRKLLLDILGLGGDYKSVVLGGSGTSAIESVIASFGGYGSKILIISNGIYGERAAAIAALYGIGVEEARSQWGDSPDLELVESRMRSPDIGAVYIVHHETTTGLLNPLKDIARMANKHGKLVLVDAVSSIAGEALDVAGWGVDAAIGSANKCIRGVPGISFVITSGRFLKTIKECRSKSFCTDLLRHVDMEEMGQTPFTPPVQSFYAFEEALKELKEEGVEERIKSYRQIANVLRKGLKGLGVEFLIPEDIMSNTMTVVRMPKGKKYAVLHDELKKKAFVIYASQGELAGDTFRLGTVGIISEKDIERFLGAMKGFL